MHNDNLIRNCRFHIVKWQSEWRKKGRNRSKRGKDGIEKWKGAVKGSCFEEEKLKTGGGENRKGRS